MDLNVNFKTIGRRTDGFLLGVISKIINIPLPCSSCIDEPRVLLSGPE